MLTSKPALDIVMMMRRRGTSKNKHKNKDKNKNKRIEGLEMKLGRSRQIGKQEDADQHRSFALATRHIITIRSTEYGVNEEES
jgi:hypothetical protein